MSEIKVMPVVEGSVVWLNNIDFVEGVMAEFLQKLRDACGHDRFVVVSTEDDSATMEVVGPDDLVEWFNEFAAATRLKHRCPETMTDLGDRTWTCIRHASHVDNLHEDPTGGVWSHA